MHVKEGESNGFLIQESVHLRNFVDFVRKHSSYYRKLWANVTLQGASTLSSFPVTDLASYWACHGCRESEVLTSPPHSGIVLQTGGTTAQPKITFLTYEELRHTVSELDACIVASGVQPMDRIANLFYAGELWGSFLLHVLSCMHLPFPNVQLPIGGACSPEQMIHFMSELDATVVIGTVTTMFKIAERLSKDGQVLPKVRLLLFSGEGLYEDQRQPILRAFPNAKFGSLIYGTMDCGIVGIPCPDAYSDPRVHRVIEPSTIAEIVPEDDDVPTTENGKPGALLVTSLMRRLQPVVRYPSGDRAEWVDYENRIFRILGRTNRGVRLGPVSIDMADIRRSVAAALPAGLLKGVQAITSRGDAKDQLTLKIACDISDKQAATEKIIEKLGDIRPMYKDHVEKRLINPLKVEFVGFEDLRVNKRTGKLLDVVDERV